MYRALAKPASPRLLPFCLSTLLVLPLPLALQAQEVESVAVPAVSEPQATAPVAEPALPAVEAGVAPADAPVLPAGPVIALPPLAETPPPLQAPTPTPTPTPDPAPVVELPFPTADAATAPLPMPEPAAVEVLAPAQQIPAPAAAAVTAKPAAKGPLLSFSSPQALRFSVYQRLAEARQLADAQAVPMAGRVNVYVAVNGLNRASIASIKLAFDERSLVDRSLLAAEVASLGEHRHPLRLTRTTLAPGSHRLQVSLAMAATGDGKGEPPVLNLDQTLDVSPLLSDLELRVDTGVIGSPRLLLRQLQRDETRRNSLVGGSLDALGLNLGMLRYPPGSDADPALGHARSLARMGQTANALVELLAEAVPAGARGQFEAPYWLEQAALLRQLGVLDRAQAICDQLDAVKLSGAAVATERLQIAEARFSAGDLGGAEAQLALAKRQLPEYRRADWRNVSGLIELARLRPGDATDTLKVANSESIDAFRYMAASTESLRATGYGRYNLAIALIRSGDVAQGKSWLDLLGRTTPTDPELLELRDKANLALGWQFLQDKQGRTALGVLGRVRTDGLSANRALLGMGWAQLAPDGERLPRASLRSEAPRAPDQLTDLPAPLRNSLTRLKVLEPELTSKLGPVSFERDDPPKDRVEGLRRAIRIWTVLAERDERDPAVLEARLALGHAQDQLRDIAAARATYSGALASLKAIDAAIERDEAFVRDGQLVATLSAIDPDDRAGFYGLMNRLRLEPGNDTTALYAAVGEQRDYRRLYKALADARLQVEALDGSEAREAMIGKLDIASRQLAIVLHGSEKQVGQQALLHLQARREVVREYMKTALLLSARAEDTPSLELRSSDAPVTP